MKYILFCNLPYAFAMLKPLRDEMIKNKDEFIWFLPNKLKNNFLYMQDNFTDSIADLKEFKSDAIFVPGNDVPYFLQGVKVQIFHGLAGEKKGHFRIRDYFDLYLTQGPYFTKKFEELALKHKNFKVIQTGWSKLDKLYKVENETLEMKKKYLQKYKNIILYAPTFSPSLTSAPSFLKEIKKLKENKKLLILIKFHDKMNKNIISEYEKIQSDNLIISQNSDITTLLQVSDIMISDTSSVVYEFLLLDKPVVTLNSTSIHKDHWINIENQEGLVSKVNSIIQGQDEFSSKREEIISMYHPYNDGKSAFRMLEAVKQYIKEFSVPKKRKISLFRKIKLYRKYK